MHQLTVDVVHFEQKANFVVGGLAGKLMNGIDEFLQRNRSRVVDVEYLENPVGEEWLRTREVGDSEPSAA